MQTREKQFGKVAIKLVAACMLIHVLVLPPDAEAVSYDATADFTITNGNPNAVWSYGWMTTNFTGFTLFTNASFVTNVLMGWWGPGGQNPSIWKNLRSSAADGVQPGQLSLHPGPNTEPAVLRWTAPAAGFYSIKGTFHPGDSGVMRVGVRLGDQFLWQATNSGSFKLECCIAAAEVIDFVVFGGYTCGNTPLEVTIGPVREADTFNPTEEMSVTGGNPNETWSYGWMTTNFTDFTLFTNSFYEAGVQMGWHGGMLYGTPSVWKNLRSSAAYGVQPGQLSLHPGPGKQPAVLRWTAPFAGFCSITGAFYAGDGGIMRVGVRRGNQFLWQGTNSGTFNMEFRVAAEETIDFVVFGGFDFGNTPLEAAIKLIHPACSHIMRTGSVFQLTITNLTVGTTNIVVYADCVTSTNWTPLVVFTGDTPTINIVDDTAGGAERRFYRIIVP